MRCTLFSIALVTCIACYGQPPIQDAGVIADARHQVDGVLHAQDLSSTQPDMLQQLPDAASAPDMAAGVYTVKCPSFFYCCDDDTLKKEAWADTCRALELCPTIITYGHQCFVNDVYGWLYATYTCDKC